MYVMLFRFLILMTLFTVPNVSTARASLTITNDFTDDDGSPVRGAVAGSTTTADMDRNHNAFTKAFNSLNYEEIIIPAGRFYFRKQLNVTHKNNGTLPRKFIRGSNQSTSINLPNLGADYTCPSTILDFSSVPLQIGLEPLFRLYGSYAKLEDPLTRDLARGATSYVLSLGKTARIGDFLILSDKNENSYGPRGYYHKGEVLKVSSVQGQTIRFAAIHDDYTANRCEIYKITPIQFELENITILDTRPKLPQNRSDGAIVMLNAGTALKVDRCEDSKIKNVHVLDASHNACISLNNAFNVDVESCSVIMALPHMKRLVRTNGYATWLPSDAYGIGIGDSQNVRVTNAVAHSWGHCMTTGSGAADMVPIVNRQIKISNSTFTNTPAPLYWQNETTAVALKKFAPANFHGNTEDSMYENNVLNGCGFNIGGHNNSFVNNQIITDNYNEPLKVPFMHWDSAFYFDEAKSAQFKILNNRVHIRKFYQNPFLKNKNDGDFYYGEFVHFNYAGNFYRRKLAQPHSETVPCNYVYKLAGKIYDQGTLEISGNEVTVECVRSEDDQVNDFRTSLITIDAVNIDSALATYLSNHPSEPQVLEIINALRVKMKMDVKITNNSFKILNNPRNSKMLVTFNPLLSKWSAIRNIEVSGNHFEGFFRVSVNAGDIFENKVSDNVVVKNNEFFSSDILDEATLLNAPNRIFPKTRANGSVIQNNIIRR